MDIFMPDDVDKTVFVVGFDEFGGAQGLETDVKPLGIGGPRSRRAADGDGDRRKFRGGIKLRSACAPGRSGDRQPKHSPQQPAEVITMLNDTGRTGAVWGRGGSVRVDHGASVYMTKQKEDRKYN